jgi:hypothetical protein
MRLRPALALTALLACGPTEPNTTDESTSASTTDGPNTTGDAPSTDTSTTADTPTTGTTAPGSTTTSDACEAQAEAACTGECMPILGQNYEFEGCSVGPVFLGCIPLTACDDTLTDVCDVDSGAAFQLPNGCIPPGFLPCAPGGLLCGAGDNCEALGEAQCMAAGCTPISGAPHVMMGDQVCVDFAQPVFLGCLVGGIACPPSVPTVCPEGQPDIAFDVPSGCLPPGHVVCDAPAPECP